jgi:hypothetical protein
MREAIQKILIICIVLLVCTGVATALLTLYHLFLATWKLDLVEWIVTGQLFITTLIVQALAYILNFIDDILAQ